MGLRKLASRLQNSFSLARFAWSFKNCCQSPATTIVAHELPLVTSFQKPLPSNDNDALTAERVEAFCGDNAPKKVFNGFRKIRPQPKIPNRGFFENCRGRFVFFLLSVWEKIFGEEISISAKTCFGGKNFFPGKLLKIIAGTAADVSDAPVKGLTF